MISYMNESFSFFLVLLRGMFGKYVETSFDLIELKTENEI